LCEDVRLAADAPRRELCWLAGSDRPTRLSHSRDAISVATFRGGRPAGRGRGPAVVFLVWSVGSVPFFLLLLSFMATSGTDHVASLLFSPPLIDSIQGKLVDVFGKCCADFLFAGAAIEQCVCCSWSCVVVVDSDILVSKRHWTKKPPAASSSSTRNHCIGGGCGCSCGRSGEG